MTVPDCRQIPAGLEQAYGDGEANHTSANDGNLDFRHHDVQHQQQLILINLKILLISNYYYYTIITYTYTLIS